MTEWTLHHEPFRHYKATNAAGKSTWNGANKQRIVSVTTVLDGDDRLVNWAAQTALGAAEHTARTFFTGVDQALDVSTLSFGQLARTTGLLPDQVKDTAGEEGSAAHAYLAARLRGWELVRYAVEHAVPYGVMQGIEDFMRRELPLTVEDNLGSRVERVVGDFDRAIAGTYDAQLWLMPESGGLWNDIHRIDLKTSKSMQPKFFAQLAEYERLAVLCGEEPSDFLTVLHIDRAGNYKLHSIKVGSDKHKMAQAYFDAHLAIYRLGPKLAKLIEPMGKETV